MKQDYLPGQMEVLTADEMLVIDGGGWLGDFVMDVAQVVFVAACGAIGGAAGTAICGGPGFGTAVGAGIGAVAGKKAWDYMFN